MESSIIEKSDPSLFLPQYSVEQRPEETTDIYHEQQEAAF
jgi:hypothetical protein